MIVSICEGLLSSFEELMQDVSYWTVYDETLMEISLLDEGEADITDVINKGLIRWSVGSAKYHAFCDVASCLEENNAVEYAGKFKY